MLKGNIILQKRVNKIGIQDWINYLLRGKSGFEYLFFYISLNTFITFPTAMRFSPGPIKIGG